jgi:hypothetical protein
MANEVTVTALLELSKLPRPERHRLLVSLAQQEQDEIKNALRLVDTYGGDLAWADDAYIEARVELLRTRSSILDSVIGHYGCGEGEEDDH